MFALRSRGKLDMCRTPLFCVGSLCTTCARACSAVAMLFVRSLRCECCLSDAESGDVQRLRSCGDCGPLLQLFPRCIVHVSRALTQLLAVI
eukprot:6200148-Pleurochrysis_carterae.AAC.2